MLSCDYPLLDGAMVRPLILEANYKATKRKLALYSLRVQRLNQQPQRFKDSL